MLYLSNHKYFLNQQFTDFSVLGVLKKGLNDTIGAGILIFQAACSCISGLFVLMFVHL